MRHLVLMTLFLAACASGPADPQAAPPVCTSPSQCDAYWNAAAIWIRHTLRQHIAERTDTMMRTVMTQSPGNYLSVRITREEIAPGTWRIDAEMYCAMKVGCEPSPWEAEQDFNRYVNNSWIEID